MKAVRGKSAVEVQVRPYFLDKPTTAKALGNISIDKLDELLRAGRIVAKVIDRRVVFEPDEVARFARECPSWEPSQGVSA